MFVLRVSVPHNYSNCIKSKPELLSTVERGAIFSPPHPRTRNSSSLAEICDRWENLKNSGKCLDEATTSRLQTKLPLAIRTHSFNDGSTIEEGERVKNQGQANVLAGRHMDIAAWKKSNTVYTVKPNGSENEMYKSTTGCGRTVSNITAATISAATISKTSGKQTHYADCKAPHSNSNWKLECELATSMWGTCVICEKRA